MLGYIDLAGVRFAGPGAAKRRVTDVQGLPGLGSAGPRVSSYDAPSRPGTVTRSRWPKGAIVTIKGLLHGGTPAETQAEYDALSIPLHDAIDTDALLTWQRPDGVELQAVGRMAGGLGLKVISGNVWEYQANISLDDPRGYTQALTTAIGTPLALSGGITAPVTAPVTADPNPGGTVAVNNLGTRPTPPRFRVYGLATAVQVLLVGTDQRFVLTGEVATGDYVEVDIVQRAVRLNGTSPAQGLFDSANSSWFELPRGTSTVRLLAATSDGATHIEVDYRSAFA